MTAHCQHGLMESSGTSHYQGAKVTTVTYEWIIHAATFLILVSYRGKGANYRVVVSITAAFLTGISLALAFYSLKFPPNPVFTMLGFVLLAAAVYCRGNVAKLFPAKKTRDSRHDIPKKVHR